VAIGVLSQSVDGHRSSTGARPVGNTTHA
jgi:hypothetical protein